MRFIDLTGQRFGKWTVIERAEDYISPAGYHTTQWLCRCDCGTERVVNASTLRSKLSKSCGCLRNELNTIRNSVVNKKYNEWIFEDNQVIGICHNNTDCRFIIDIDDYEKCKDYCWSVHSNGYIIGLINKKTTVISRFIMNPTGNLQVDHINGNRQDNRKCNLRLVTPQQNNMNRGVSTRNTSGVVGVRFNKRYSKWNANITFEGFTYSLGYYEDINDAIEARKQAEIKYFGEYRRSD